MTTESWTVGEHYEERAEGLAAYVAAAIRANAARAAGG